MKPSIGVIGAGPAGIAAALEAARSGARVTLYDGNSSPGKKLLVTGSGRCNITNANVVPSRYFSSSPLQLLDPVFEEISHSSLIEWLEQLNIPTYQTEDGWFYPISNSAANVVEILVAHLKQLDVIIQTNFEIAKIDVFPKGFRLITETGEKMEHGKIIVACGGKAYPNLGSKGNLFTQIQNLGHSILEMTPALAPVMTEVKTTRPIQGVRLDAKITLYQRNQPLQTTIGNVIFTDFGINGPGVMDLSHNISRILQNNPGSSLWLEVDFSAGNQTKLRKVLEARESQNLAVKVLLLSLFPPKLTWFLLERANIPAETKVSELNQPQIENIIKRITQFSVEVKGVRGFEYCQVAAGGIPLEKINLPTMQSRIVPNLYFAGEIIDVTGPCGGYNLHWAWISGIMAGRSAGI